VILVFNRLHIAWLEAFLGSQIAQLRAFADSNPSIGGQGTENAFVILKGHVHVGLALDFLQNYAGALKLSQFQALAESDQLIASRVW